MGYSGQYFKNTRLEDINNRIEWSHLCHNKTGLNSEHITLESHATNKESIYRICQNVCAKCHEPHRLIWKYDSFTNRHFLYLQSVLLMNGNSDAAQFRTWSVFCGYKHKFSQTKFIKRKTNFRDVRDRQTNGKRITLNTPLRRGLTK